METSTADAIRSQAEIHAKIAHLYSVERVHLTVFNRAFNQYWNRLVLSLLPGRRDGRVLDLMGGTGLLSHALVAAGYENVLIVDLSVDMLTFARHSLGQRVRLCAGDAMRLPLGEESLDVVVCRGGLHHLPDIPAALREAHRALKKGGVLLAFDPCDDVRLVRWIRGMMYWVFSFFDDEHERGLTSGELLAAFEAAGFTVKETRRFGFVGYMLSGVEAHLFPRLCGWLPRLNFLGDWMCKLDERLEGSPFLLAMSIRAVKE